MAKARTWGSRATGAAEHGEGRVGGSRRDRLSHRLGTTKAKGEELRTGERVGGRRREAPPWERVDGVFTRSLELDPEDRATFLENASEGDVALRKAVEKLLSTDADAEGSSFLSQPVAVIWRRLWENALREVLVRRSF